MVAVRSAHLNQDEQFELENWVASLGQEKNTAKRLTEVYQTANLCWRITNRRSFCCGVDER